MAYPKLTKEDYETASQLVGEFNLASANIEDATDRIDVIISDELIPYVRKFNELVKRIDEFRNSVVSRMEEHIEEQREGWDETDKGANYVEWKDEWESLNLEVLPIPDTMQRDENVQMAEAFDGLEVEPA